MSQDISDVAGGLYKIEWDENPDGPDERMIEESHELCDIIVACAEEDEDATVKRIV